MAVTKNSLGKIHRLHLKREGTQTRLERGPKQIKARENLIATKHQELEEARSAHKKLKMKADELSLQLKTNEARIEELKLRLNAAASNKEFNIIKGQIDADTVSNSVLEDEILEALEKVDDSTAALAAMEQGVKDAEEQTRQAIQQVSDAEPGLRDESAQLNELIREAETTIPAKVSEQYRRLVQTHGAGAMADVTNSVCGNCYVTITPQMMVQLRTGTVIFCNSCGRMLYLSDDE